jgi:hypothetical protein
MKVIAKQRMPYGKRQYQPGEEIEMSDKDAKLLAATGRVSLPEEGTGKAPQKPAMPPADEDDAKGRAKRQKGYKRRDMRAEDEHTEDVKSFDPEKGE